MPSKTLTRPPSADEDPTPPDGGGISDVIDGVDKIDCIDSGQD
jgi:hypothetical protein